MPLFSCSHQSQSDFPCPECNPKTFGQLHRKTQDKLLEKFSTAFSSVAPFDEPDDEPPPRPTKSKK